MYETKSGVLRLALAGNAALCAERSRNDSISCCEEHKLHSHVQPSFAEPGAIPKSQGPAVADAQSPGKVGLHPARTGLYQSGADRRYPSGRPRVGAGRLYRADKGTGQPGTAAGSGVHHLRRTPAAVQSTGVGITCVGKSDVGKSYVGKFDAIK